MNNGPIKSCLNFIVFVCNAEACSANKYTIRLSWNISSLNIFALLLYCNACLVLHSSNSLPTNWALASNKLLYYLYLTGIVSILGNERLVKSGGSLRNTN